MTNLPYMPLYPRDFFADEAVTLMSGPARGAYALVLFRNWQHESVPDDPQAIAKLIGWPEEEFLKLWPEIQDRFLSDGNGRLTNPRVEEDLVATKNRRVTLSVAGKKGANQRWGNVQVPTPQRDNSQAIGRPSPPNSISSQAKPYTSILSPEQLPKETNDYPPEFEELWKTYPPKPGNPKRRAFKAYQDRISEGITPTELLVGVRTYAKTRKGQDPKYTRLAATFLGPDEHWKETYETEEQSRARMEKDRPPLAHHCALCDTDFDSPDRLAYCPTCGRQEEPVKPKKEPPNE
jgi:uncharacterized protein YdaU (DUF1376 family)